jgi:hypothetical protein
MRDHAKPRPVLPDEFRQHAARIIVAAIVHDDHLEVLRDSRQDFKGIGN